MDPYSDWLGLPPGPRPPTHYDLLGLAPDDCGKDAVERAAVERTAAARKYQSGRFAEEATALLNRIAAARFALLDPARRAAYDAELAAGPADDDFDLDAALPGLAFPAAPQAAAAPAIVVAMPTHAPAAPPPPLPGSLVDEDDVAEVSRSYLVPAVVVGVLGVAALAAWPYLTRQQERQVAVVDDGSSRIDRKAIEDAARKAREQGIDRPAPKTAGVAPDPAPDAGKAPAPKADVPFEAGESVLVSFKDGPRNAKVLRGKPGKYYVGYDGLDDSQNEWVDAARVAARGTRAPEILNAPRPPGDDERAVEAYLAALKGSDPKERQRALQRLAAIPPAPGKRKAVAEALHALLDHKTLRLEAAVALGRWGTAETVPLFVEWLRERPTPPAAAILAAGQLGAEELVQPLVELLKVNIQPETTVSALGRLGPKAEPETLRLLDHWDAKVRASACEALAEIAGPQAQAALEGAAKNAELAEAANAALARLAQRRKRP